MNDEENKNEEIINNENKNEESEVLKILKKINTYITETIPVDKAKDIEVPVIPETPEVNEEEEFTGESEIEKEPLSKKLRRVWNKIYYG